MKKVVAFLCVALCAAMSYAACEDGPYGLQINGSKVVDAPKYGDADAQGRVQYKAGCVELKNGDKIKLINQSCGDTWMVDIDPYGEYQKFTGGKEAGQLTCTADGNYDFYIKLSASAGDLVYIGPGEGCGDEPGCKDGPYGLKINGTTVVDAPLYGDPDYEGRKQYMASCVELAAGDVIQLVNQSCDATWMVDLDQYGYYENFTGGKAANQLTCNVAGKYDFYIKLSATAGDLVYVESSQTCGGDTPTPQPGYTTSAPAQCPDVLLQAFYWDSYMDKGYGRTKWIDHINANNGSNAEEIGKWFDLVWLPPMSKATGGTGYIPSNYSDLNSDWGTKKRLVQLIETLHKNGARVVADIVINHGAALSGWCDFAQLNFGSYGTFKPDASWICKTDEMNYSDEAGACKGKATGNADDGYYGDDDKDYRSARDWDHTQTKVQDMFKAYLKWLRYDIKIDGFRYDYCKGFHNSHINDYNTAAQAYFSVMEMWDGSLKNPSGEIDPTLLNQLIDNLPSYGVYLDDSMLAANTYGGYLMEYGQPIFIPIIKDHEIKVFSRFLISVNHKQTDEEKFHTICHELGHLFCRHQYYNSGKIRRPSQKEREFEAETVAWLVCKRHGITNPSEEYLATYAPEGEIPICSTDLIMRAVTEIEKMLEKKVYATSSMWYAEDKNHKSIVDKERKRLAEQKKKK